ncbi:MAG: DUF935 family protein, partial [Syntrophobacter sp.]
MRQAPRAAPLSTKPSQSAASPRRREPTDMAILFDQFDRPIEAGAAKRPDSREISIASVRDRWSTYPSNGLTPQRLASILRAADNGDV